MSLKEITTYFCGKSLCLIVFLLWTNLFEDGADSDCCWLEGRHVAELIINGTETFRVPPGKLSFPVKAAGFN